MLKRKQVFSLAVALGLSQSTLAKDSGQIDYLVDLSLSELKDLYVTIATQSNQTQTQAPATTSVITAEEILATGAQTLEDALEAAPGVFVSRNGLNYSPRYFIRGIVSQFNPQTLFLVNGVPMTSISTGDRGQKIPRQYSLSAKAIERIEIIRGPGSALYGADAFAGVINVITKGHDDLTNGSELSIAAGSFDTKRVSFNSPFSWHNLKGAALISYQKSDGDKNAIIESDVQTNIDALMLGPPASLAPGPAGTHFELYEGRLDIEWQDIRAHGTILKVDEHGRGAGPTAAIGNGLFERLDYNFDVTWNKNNLFPDLDLKSRLAYINYNGNSEDTGGILFPPGAFFGAFPQGVLNYATIKEQSAMLDLQADYHAGEKHRWLLGAGYHWKDLYKVTSRVNYELIGGFFVPSPLTDVSDTDQIFLPERQRTNYYFMVQDEWKIAKDWTLTSGLRFDEYSDFGNATTPRLALVWNTSEKFTTKLLYGEAFRAPSVTELFVTSVPTATGNPNLKPATLKNIELAFVWKPAKRITASLNTYRYDVDDEIRYTPAPGGITRAANIGRIDGNGFESEVRYKYSPHLQFVANYSYQDTKDITNGGTTGWVPKQFGYGRVEWQQGHFTVSPQIRYSGKRHREIFDPRDNLKGYTAVDISARYQSSNHWSIAFIGKNLTNKDTRDASRGPNDSSSGAPNIFFDDPQFGRSLNLELSINI